MRGGRPKPGYTTTRHVWLQTLADRPGSLRRGQGPCAHSCRSLGWTRPALASDPSFGEELTDEGRRILARWNGEQREPEMPPAPASLTGIVAAPVTAGGLLDGYETEECTHDVPASHVCDADHRKRTPA